MNDLGLAPLTAKLCSYAVAGVRSLPGQAETVEARLTGLLTAGRAAWSELPLSDDEFLLYLAERLPEDAKVPDALDGVNAADLYLAGCCTLGVPRALQAFERHCFATLPAVLCRYSTSDEFHDEVRQAVRERLFVGKPGATARIADYAGRGSLAGWVRVVAVRLAVDLLRQRGKSPAALSDDVLQTLASGADTELQFLVGRYRDEVRDAFRESFAALSPAERNLLRLHHLDGLTIDELAAMKRVHRSTVARRIARCCEFVAANTHRVLIARLGIAPSQVASVMRLVRSQLDLSLDRWLGPSPPQRR